ncbi:MAG: NADH:flavin oxidoreductase [Nitrospinae bacterium]|nr:NADH:flavin oxidoreductase [Nitrospinota bacterium]
MYTPIKIGSLEMRNRFIRSATHEYMADGEGFVNERIGNIYRQLAGNGVACIITGHAYIQPNGKASERQASISDDKFIDGYKKMVAIAHAGGSKIVLQAAHGGRQSKPELCGGDPVCPSAVPDAKTGIHPREMREEEINQVIDSFAEAARRGRDAGFDAVQLHAAHGYLLSQFLSPHTNRREDQWGGSEENRFRIISGIMAAVRKKAGNDFPVWIKLNSEDFIETGLKVSDSIKIAKRLETAGVGAIEVSGGMMEAGPKTARTGIAGEKDEGYFLSAALEIKKAIGVPIFVVGGFRSAAMIQKALDQGIDMVSLARPLVREPDLIKKFKEGKKRADCISCNGCFNPEGIRCKHA